MQLDPVTVEVLRNGLSYTAEEMGIALRNSAYSHNIKERMDHSCALFDPQGNLVAQAEHIPVHLGSLPWGTKNVLQYWAGRGEAWRRDDTVIVNDPYVVGTHLNDVTLIRPIVFEGNVIAFSANKAHHVDVGGRISGSISCDATSLHEEGVVLSPTRLVEQGHVCQQVLQGLLDEVRSPHITQGDLRAQLAAATLGERRVLELARRYGVELLFSIFQEIIDQGERRMRAKLAAIPAGIYRGEDCLELGRLGEADARIWIRVAAERNDRGLTVSFSGTDPQVDVPLNAVFGVTLSATYFAIRSIIDPAAPMNEGVLRPIHVSAPTGSLVNPRRPAPVSGGNLETSQRIADTVFRALAEALPHRVPAASHGSMNNVIAGGFDPQRERRWVFYETIGGGSGGRPGGDGVDGIQCNMTNTMNTPIEAIEQYYPLLFEQYDLRPNTRGAGRWRGGCGITRAWTLLGPSAEVTVLGERTEVPPWGLAGGKPGGLAAYWVRRQDGKKEKLKSKVTLTLRQGDTLIIQTPGGGGFGNPEERDARAPDVTDVDSRSRPADRRSQVPGNILVRRLDQ
jgi:N-methylhydantoinase B